MEEPTHIKVTATTRYLESHSNPEQGEYAFGYAITILNEGPKPAKLLQRHWIVMSDNGRRQEVRGEGVVGEKPRLEPGGVFNYTSWTVLETPTGQMEGRYLFITDEGEQFWASIPPFFMEVPGSRVLH
ncbi:MAG: Co2+/Mg2+ efflux protein ApaG [Magnetococcales bacterium]|nr:Co2+/Mg2+ efflux protein ApaG [Magnetococcales bacterium]MBF0149321.1 Co2+/Mg2+ efflux protein ApaG [Magnetococcales bacterium]MBF0174572.1 Co2+/Mg2+ efflux protein ApaG [Magnetococcales bacterium]MBF0349188.1 Co2+/Mg2+ efflux protein ApaG [Magnetococcales bacterium]MBF0632953.1 Co2+/Mg2+ efflux protein ApaG [Magnetococcales bacterium]